MPTKREHVPVELWYVSRLRLCLMLILQILGWILGWVIVKVVEDWLGYDSDVILQPLAAYLEAVVNAFGAVDLEAPVDANEADIIDDAMWDALADSLPPGPHPIDLYLVDYGG